MEIYTIIVFLPIIIYVFWQLAKKDVPYARLFLMSLGGWIASFVLNMFFLPEPIAGDVIGNVIEVGILFVQKNLYLLFTIALIVTAQYGIEDIIYWFKNRQETI